MEKNAVPNPGCDKAEGWKYICRFVFFVLLFNANFMNKLYLNDFLKTKNEKFTNFTVHIYITY